MWQLHCMPEVLLAPESFLSPSHFLLGDTGDYHYLSRIMTDQSMAVINVPYWDLVPSRLWQKQHELGV